MLPLAPTLPRVLRKKIGFELDRRSEIRIKGSTQRLLGVVSQLAVELGSVPDEREGFGQSEEMGLGQR